jgi:hypothetical protein
MNANESGEKKCVNSIIKIHFGYIVSILLAIIIALLTVQWSEIPNLANYLNFALGAASLVLAVVAIVYAFFANNSFSMTVAKLDSAASTIKDETTDLEKAVQGLEEHVKEIPKALHLLEDKMSKTHALIEASSQQQKAQPIQNDAALLGFINAVMDYFLSISSWNGLKVLYVCQLAFEKQKQIDLKEWTELDKTISFDYAFGYLVSSSSAGFFNHTMEGTKVKVSVMPPQFVQKIRPAIDLRLKTLPPDTRSQIEIIQKFVD